MENIYTVFYPFYLTSKFIGLFPKSFVGTVEKKALKLRFIDLFSPTFLFCILIYLFYQTISFPYIQSDSSILTIAWNYSLILELYGITIQILYQVLHCSAIRNLLEIIHNFDQDLKEFHVFLNHKKHKLIVYLSIICFFILNVAKFLVFPIINILNRNIVNFSIVVACSYAFVSFYSLFFSLQLALASFAVKLRFRLLIDVLR